MPDSSSRASKAPSGTGTRTGSGPLFALSLTAVAYSICFALAAAFPFAQVDAAEKKADTMPPWFVKAMKKEKRVRRGAKFETKDGFVSGRIPGKLIGKPEAGDGVWYLSSNLGAESPMECWFFTDQVNTAFALNQMTDSILNLVGEKHGGLLSRNVFGLDADHLDGVPVLSADWLYTVGTKDASQVGLLKLRTALIASKTLVCAHNFLGYQATFSKAFNELVESLEFKKDGAEKTPYYSSLYLNALGDKRLGFTRTLFYLDKDGDTETHATNVLLVPVDNSTLSSNDSENLSFSTPKGELINAVAVSVENGEVTMDLRLDFQEEKWLMQGTFQGKPLQTSIEPTATVLSELGQNLEVRDLQKRILADKSVAGAGSTLAPVSLSIWVPDVDPTTLLEATVELQTNAKEGVLTFGPIAMDAVFDDFGEVEKGNYSLGGTTLEIERVWTQGQISDGFQ